MPANSRKTIRVNDVLPDSDFSTRVHAAQADNRRARHVLGRRGSTPGEACHDSIGMSAPHTTFYLPDGETADGLRDLDAGAEPERRRRDGRGHLPHARPERATPTFTDTVPANSRKTYSMADRAYRARAAVLVHLEDRGQEDNVRARHVLELARRGTDTIGGYSD